MRRPVLMVMLALPVLGTHAVLGCVFHSVDDCEVTHSCPPGGGGSDGGMGGGTPAGCIPNATMGAIDNSCGVFVSSSLGDDANPGSKDKPLKTLGAALAKSKSVYACGEGFTEAVSVAASATLYGGLACTKGWAYDVAKKTQFTATPGAVPLSVSKAATRLEVFDFAITSVNAKEDGGSSIAVLAAQAAVSLTRCDVTAGDGKAGLAGAAFGSEAQAGADGKPGTDACAADTSLGGKAVTNACGGGDSVSGGGGFGDSAAGGDGTSGQPGATTNGGKGEGAQACVPGTKGDDGGPGTPGTGATGLGTLSASGFAGASGGEGNPGAVAQGGGGGGGAKGETTANACSAGMGGGASGGSGSSGGCGGLGGKGGGAGGASIAIVSLDAMLSFASVTLKVGSGGAGGDGGTAQAGGTGGAKGGTGGMGKGALKAGCAGGLGGKGGDGGRGGGGLGGHAIGIAATGAAPATTGVTFMKGTAGLGGKGDNAGGNLGDGAAGVVAGVQVFP